MRYSPLHSCAVFKTSFICAVKQYDALLITATVDGVKDWCPSLTTQNLQEAFKNLCHELAFSILPDQKDDTIAAVWFSCWNNLLCLNGMASV